MADLVRPPWIALAAGPPFTELDAMGGARNGLRLHVVGEPTAFADLLADARPHVVVVAAPPATEADEALAIHERRRRPSLRIVHVTRPADVDRRLDALRRGFDEALTSAIGPAELLERLRILDERARTRHASEIPVADGVVLDPIAHEVRRGNELIHLRPKEFQLLAMLAAHPGRAYTRRQLLDRVWGHGHDGDPRTVDVHVRWLRAKIEPIPETPVHLVTVRGVGYRLDPDAR
jgi:DNA-binding response OmpR family regulator